MRKVRWTFVAILGIMWLVNLIKVLLIKMNSEAPGEMVIPIEQQDFWTEAINHVRTLEARSWWRKPRIRYARWPKICICLHNESTFMLNYLNKKLELCLLIELSYFISTFHPWIEIDFLKSFNIVCLCLDVFWWSRV